jgi:hypothetical protein
MEYTVVKIVNNIKGEQILIYPERQGDKIYSYDNLLEAEECINNIKNYPIYSDCELTVCIDGVRK